MKKLLLLVLIVGIYLNRSYAYYYDFIGHANLTAPDHPAVVSVGSQVNLPTIRYVALGDSLTAGVGVSDYKNSYPYLIAKQLSFKNQVRLINLAHPGDNSIDLIHNQLPQVLALKPDLVTLLIGVNDIHNLKSENEFRNNYWQIITTLKKTNAKIYVYTIPDLGSQKIVYFPYNLLMDWRTREFNNVIKKFAQDNQLNLVDLYSISKVDDFYSADQFHPGSAGYEQWAKATDVE